MRHASIVVALGFMGTAVHAVAAIPPLSSSQLLSTSPVMLVLTVGNLVTTAVLGAGSTLLLFRHRISRWFILGGACLGIAEIGLIMAPVISFGAETQEPLLEGLLLVLLLALAAPVTTLVLVFTRQTRQYCR